MVQSSCANLPKKILLGFDTFEDTVQELVVEANLEMYIDVDLIWLVLASIMDKTPIMEILNKKIDLDTQSAQELKEYIASIKFRLVTTLRSVGCYDKDGKLMYRFVMPIERGFLLEKV